MPTPIITQENKTRVRIKQQLMREWRGDRKMICCECGLVMNDYEPCSKNGEYYHKRTDRCSNDGKVLHNRSSERHLKVRMFRKKSERRNRKRISKRFHQ